MVLAQKVEQVLFGKSGKNLNSYIQFKRVNLSRCVLQPLWEKVLVNRFEFLV